MWAPADLFTPVLDIVLMPMKRAVTYFYEHPLALALAVLAVALLIALVTMAGDRIGRRR